MTQLESRLLKACAEHYHFAKYAARVCIEMLGTSEKTCPMCGFRGRFRAFGLPPRFDAECPSCKSLERHRLLHLCNTRHGLFRPELDVLHFAPEPAVTAFVKPHVRRYRSADMAVGRADMHLDIEAIALPDAALDMVIASHVLEHVDDARAIGEVFRILKPQGVAIFMFPIIEGWDGTYENDAVVDERMRLLHFGQRDHVRYYGRDVRGRLADGGFVVEEFCGTPADCLAFGLQRGERVFITRKPEC